MFIWRYLPEEYPLKVIGMIESDLTHAEKVPLHMVNRIATLVGGVMADWKHTKVSA